MSTGGNLQSGAPANPGQTESAVSGIGPGTSAGHGQAQQDSSGFTGPDPSGKAQSGASAPDLTDDQGASNIGVQKPDGVMGKIKQAFSTTEPDGTPKKTA